MTEFTLNDEPINFTLNAERTEIPDDHARLLEDGYFRLTEDGSFRVLESLPPGDPPI